MPRPTQQATPEGIRLVEDALCRRNWTHTDLAQEAGLSTRQSISRLINGKKVEKKAFVKICEALDLDWQHIADMSNLAISAPDDSDVVDINSLVQEARQKVQPMIQEVCGNIRVFGRSQLFKLEDLYVNLNFSKNLTRERRIDSEYLENRYRTTQKVNASEDSTKEEISDIEAVRCYDKILVWGMPGSGKTTFLKYIASQCMDSILRSDLVPVFLSLRHFSQDFKQSTISDFESFFIQSLEDLKINKATTTTLLLEGKFLILLDGLDETKEDDRKFLLEGIRRFLSRFLKNKFVLTCRLGLSNLCLENVVELEIKNLNSSQAENILSKLQKLIKKVDNPLDKNQELKLLLDKIKIVIARSKRTNSLSLQPLLLTLVFTSFGGRKNLPNNSFDIYKEALDTLLSKWDDQKGVDRGGEIYENLSLRRRRDLLSFIAYQSLQDKNYFMRESDICKYIYSYICNLDENIITEASDDELLHDYSKSILEAIEIQHGIIIKRGVDPKLGQAIYSFSHCTFYEYYIARKIALDSSLWEELMQKVSDKFYHPLFPLTIGVLSNADHFIQMMKNEVDNIVASDKECQEHLKLINEVSEKLSQESPRKIKIACLRAFHLNLNLDCDVFRPLECEIEFDSACVLSFAVVLHRVLRNKYPTIAEGIRVAEQANIKAELEINSKHYRSLDPILALALDRLIAIERLIQESADTDFKKNLVSLLSQVPPLKDRITKEGEFHIWWEKQEEGRQWLDQFLNILLDHKLSLGDISVEGREKLKLYYHANLLLMKCIRSKPYLSRTVVEKIENTLLLPIDFTKSFENQPTLN